jgi:hypothetical protein
LAGRAIASKNGKQNGKRKRPAKKTPADEPGLESLFAVITSRLLLREEKQGRTTLRLSSGNDVIRAAAAVPLRSVA